MNKDSLINFKKMIEDYEIKYKSTLDKDIDLQNILLKSKLITENLLDIYERDLILLEKIDTLLKNNNSINDRENLIKVQKDMMDEFKHLNNTISHISGLPQITEIMDNDKPVSQPVNDSKSKNPNTSLASTNIDSESTPTSSKSESSTSQSESTTLLENIKKLFSDNLYFYSNDDDSMSSNSNVVDSILSSKDDDSKPKSKGKAKAKAKAKAKTTSSTVNNKKKPHKTAKKPNKKLKLKLKPETSIKQVILPNYDIDSLEISDSLKGKNKTATKKDEKTDTKKDEKKTNNKKDEKKNDTKKDCDYGLENIDNNFPKIKQFRKKTKKNKHKN